MARQGEMHMEATVAQLVMVGSRRMDALQAGGG